MALPYSIASLVHSAAAGPTGPPPVPPRFIPSLGRTYRRRAGLWVGFLFHLTCWVASALEVWIALRLAGRALDFAAVLVIESLLYAIRTVAFAIPNAVGVQEGAYILLGGAFGLTPDMAIALSLLKRARDLAIGLPALGAWQALEGGRLWRRFAPRPVVVPIAKPVRTWGEDRG
jgi:Lysylphosphatidylglycerol synthase TM region